MAVSAFAQNPACGSTNLPRGGTEPKFVFKDTINTIRMSEDISAFM
jgi:hypothetical protein